MDMKDFLWKLYEVFLKFFYLYIVYSSVLVGILLFPMLILYGIFVFLLRFYRVSWIFADPFIIGEDFHFVWLNAYLYDCPFIYTKEFQIIKLLIFLVGLILFLISISQLVYGILKHKSIVRLGIYKYIRHPQNLSIIIMAFPFFIFYGIRIGDLISWVQFIFLIIIYSDLGDLRLKKKFPEEFQDYYETTGFMFPILLPYKLTKHFSVIDNKKLRYFVMVSLYLLIIRLFYLIYIIFPFSWLWM